MESDLYIALARADEQSFRAEWNLAASLNIPAFGYVCGPVESAFRPAPRHVESEAQLLGLLACDLYYYTNRGLLFGQHPSVRHTVANPSLLCIILCSMPLAAFRKVCGGKEWASAGSRMEVCQSFLAGCSSQEIKAILDCLEEVFPGVLAPATGTAEEGAFRFRPRPPAGDHPQVKPATFDRASGQTTAEHAAGPEKDPLVPPGELGKWQQFLKVLFQREHRGRAVMYLAVLAFVLTGAWVVKEFGKESVVRFGQYVGERRAPKYYHDDWAPDMAIGPAAYWQMLKGGQWNSESRGGRAMLCVPEETFGICNLRGLHLGDYHVFFRVELNQNQESVTWIVRGQDANDYFAVEYKFQSSPRVNRVEAYVYANGERTNITSQSFNYAPPRNGDGLEVTLDVSGSKPVMAAHLITLTRNLDLPPVDRNGPDQSLKRQEFKVPINDATFSEGYLGFKADKSSQAFYVYDLQLKAK